MIGIAASCYSQSVNFRFPENPNLTDNFKNAINGLESEFKRLFHDDSTAKNYPTDSILNKIDNDSEYYYLFLAEYWIAFHYKEIIPELIKRVTIKKEIGLVNSADLIITERIANNQMKFYGHGLRCADDLFTVSGRANRLLTAISGEDFGHVSMYSTTGQLKTLQRKWIRWLSGLQSATK